MLSIHYHKNFKKQFARLPKKIQDKFWTRIAIFLRDPYSMELNNHPLSGEWGKHRSMDITGDIRAVYRIENEMALFATIGSHSQLYGK